jgi:TPR repeat protein
MERLKKRVGGGDVIAMRNLGYFYHRGEIGLPQDRVKAVELWLRAGELGCVTSYGAIADAYRNGEGVERDMEKAKHYYELGAKRGDVEARHNLGVNEGNAGNIDRAVKHFMISAIAGLDESLKEIQKCFMKGYATKNDFENALRSHKESKDEMRSDQREAADAFYGHNEWIWHRELSEAAERANYIIFSANME